jgi:hypothetical protein
MEELERQSAGSTGGFDAFTPPANRPLSDAELDAVEMREGAGTMLQQTPFGQATDPTAPQTPKAPQRPLSDYEMDNLADETVRDPSYVPTFNEWDEWDQKRAARSSSVDGFLKGAGSIAQAIGSVAYSVGATPGNFVMRGFGPAYDTLVHSSAEGMRRAGVGMAEMITWASDTAADIRMSTEREAALDNRLRKQMAEGNAFTGNAQADAQIFAQAKEKARSEGFYELTQGQQSSDRREQYDRFVRGRALEQEFLGIGNFTMGNDPIATGNLFGPKFVGGQPSQITAEATTKTDYGIDDSKVDEGIATGVMIAGDPSGWLPLGVGALNKVKAVRRLAVLADKPMGWTAGGLGRVARIAENIEAKALGAGLTTDRLARASGAVAIGAGAIGISQNNDLAKGIAAAATILPAVRYSGKILRRAEGAAQAGQMVIKEMGVGGVGVLRADSASRLADNAAIPGRYRDAMRGFFSGPESSLKRASQNEALPLSARKTMARLDRAGATQAFRIADDAVSGALAGSVVGLPFAAIAPEDKQAEIFGSIAAMGALGGAVSGPLTRRSQMADADVARMLADIEAVGGDAATFAQLPHDKLVRMAAMQGVVSSKVDFVPLRADEYAANKVLNAKNATTTKGLYVDAEDGNRPRIFINIDQLAAGDVGGHEIGHAILKSDILGGEIKNNMRNLVNVQYGQDGVVARGREYATKLLADEVEQGVTGDMPQVLSDAEMQQVDRGAKPEDIIRSRWQDKDMRERMINERIDEMNQREMAGGGMEWDWARDEIAAETFSGLSGGIDFRNIRQSGPMAAALGAFSGTLDMMGARFRGNGRLETPNRLFEENPLMDTPQMRKAVTDYTKAFDRYLAGMERDAAPKQRGTKVAPTGKASEAARSQHNRVYTNDKVVENDIFIVDANGNQIPKSQQQIDTQEKARAATLKSINKRDRLVPMHSNEWGARKVGNRTEVGGPNLPMQFDHFVQVPEWLRTKAREFEAGRKKGQSYRISYNAIGTGVSGSYKIKNLGNVEAITREMVPFGWQLSEKNHLLAKAIDLDAFRSAAIRAVDRGELPDFGNNVKQVEADLKAMLKNYEDGLPGETGIGVLKRNVLNGLLGTGTAVQKAANPLYAELNPKGSIRTFRFDRLNYADSYATGYFPHYHKINTNALPREAGVMSLDEWRQFDADRKSVWINNRAREAGYTNAENWRGADEAGFGAADAQYRSEFPVPAQGGAAALPGDAKRAPKPQKGPDIVHDDNYTLSPQVPDRGYYIIGTKPTADGRVLEYHVDPKTTLQPRVAGIDSISGEQVAMLEADRHNTRGDNMGGPLHPFLINNQTVVYLPDGRGYKPVWANMNSGFVTRAKNIVKNTTAGHALIQIMKENAHRSNRKFVMDVTSEIDARRASMSDNQADFLHVLLELGAINPQGRINQAYNRVKRLSDEALENKAPMSELAEAQRQYDVTFEKYGPMAEFLTRMGPLKNHSTRGRMKEFQGEFDSLMSKYRNAPWFSAMSSKYRNTKFVDEAARFSFKQRGAAMDRITGIPFAPDVKKMLDDSMDFVNGKNLDVVGVVQLSKDADAFAVYFGKNAKEESKMSANERLLRDQLLASGTFRPHPSYDWVMLGPENADSFILNAPADPLKLFPDYAKNHPNPKVRGGTKETVAGTMKKSKIPLILK